MRLVRVKSKFCACVSLLQTPMIHNVLAINYILAYVNNHILVSIDRNAKIQSKVISMDVKTNKKITSTCAPLTKQNVIEEIPWIHSSLLDFVNQFIHDVEKRTYEDQSVKYKIQTCQTYLIYLIRYHHGLVEIPSHDVAVCRVSGNTVVASEKLGPIIHHCNVLNLAHIYTQIIFSLSHCQNYINYISFKYLLKIIDVYAQLKMRDFYE